MFVNAATAGRDPKSEMPQVGSCLTDCGWEASLKKYLQREGRREETDILCLVFFSSLSLVFMGTIKHNTASAANKANISTSATITSTFTTVYAAFALYSFTIRFKSPLENLLAIHSFLN